MRFFGLSTVSILMLVFGACSSPYLPEGDAAAGRVAFQELGCHSCHRVHGQDFPKPVAQPPLDFVLGSPYDKKSRAYLAESIIAPSHRFAHPRPRVLSEHPAMQQMEELEYKNIREGKESRMGDYNDYLTVRQWLDLVAFLDSVQQGQ